VTLRQPFSAAVSARAVRAAIDGGTRDIHHIMQADGARGCRTDTRARRDRPAWETR
jgi:hypothetical protein